MNNELKEALEELLAKHGLFDMAEALLAIAEDFTNDLGIVAEDPDEVAKTDRLIMALTLWKDLA